NATASALNSGGYDFIATWNSLSPDLHHPVLKVSTHRGQGPCAVLLLGAHLSIALHDRQQRELFSPATQAQIELSSEIAEQLADTGLDGIREAVNLCLDENEEWQTLSRRALAAVRYADSGLVRDEAVAQREAFDLAATGRHAEAAERLGRAIGDITDPALRGWLCEQRAAYLHHVDAAAAQKMLAKALNDNPFLLRPISGVTPVQLRPAAAQAEAAAKFLAAEYSNGTALLLAVQALLEDVVWGDEKRSEDAERAWQQLGQHLGFTSTRPEKMYTTGPDNLWVLSHQRHAVIELKTGRQQPAINKHDLDQLGGSVRWDLGIHPHVKPLPVIVHPSRKLDHKAIAVDGMRVITPQSWQRLAAAVRSWAEALTARPERWGDPQAVREQLTHHQLTGGELFSAYSQPPIPHDR
uniref:hypothetical protein n=1 Tax=Nonomuraea sp. SYSU D8015 TaxID=2593644 RepID=UPI001CB6FBCA